MANVSAAATAQKTCAFGYFVRTVAASALYLFANSVSLGGDVFGVFESQSQSFPPRVIHTTSGVKLAKTQLFTAVWGIVRP